jgi:O-succinylbenzoic acid--CoA ligase
MNSDAPALIASGEVIAYSAMRERIAVATGRLRTLGVGARSRVGLWAENGPEWIVIALAVSQAGGVLVPLNTRLTNAEIEWQLARAQLPVVIAGDALAGRRPRGCRVVSLGEWASLAAAGGSPDPGFDNPGRDHAIVFTSGTTGRPKGAVLSWGNQVASVRAAAAALPLARSDRWLASLPFFHVGGLAIVFRCLLAGACVVIPDSFSAADLNDAIDADGVTHVSLVDAMLRRILEARAGRAFPPQLRAAVVGGGPVTGTLLDACPQALASYGLTETCSMVTLVRPEAPAAQRRTAGGALPGVGLRIAHDGIIEVRGPMVMRGYLDDAEATGAALRDGWLRTGDLGEIDADGMLRVLDRRDDLIISGGENVYPAEIAQVLREHPEVADAVVIGVADGTWGQVPLAVVVARASSRPDLRAFLEARLARYKVPRIVYAAEIPRLASGKPDRAAVRALYGQAQRK